MTFTIEPMLNLGTHELGHVGRRLDRRHQGPARSAQFEHTLLVTGDRRGDPDSALTPVEMCPRLR